MNFVLRAEWKTCYSFNRFTSAPVAFSSIDTEALCLSLGSKFLTALLRKIQPIIFEHEDFSSW